MDGPRKVVTPRLVVQLLLVVVALPLLPLLISGKWGWWEAWVYALLAIFGFVISRILALRRHPDLAAERARFADHEDTKRWDRVLS
jgi:cytochrome c-type biogenesis protein CcmH/NrfG